MAVGGSHHLKVIWESRSPSKVRGLSFYGRIIASQMTMSELKDTLPETKDTVTASYSRPGDCSCTLNDGRLSLVVTYKGSGSFE